MGSGILLLRKVSNPEYSGIVTGISYIRFVLKDIKIIRPLKFFFSPFGQPLLSPSLP